MRTPRTARLPRYAVWNNKGGVGKTFVAFIAAAEYARLNPDKIVVVIDMCPQANISEILLGGNGNGATQLNILLAKSTRQTIGGYFDQRLNAPHSKTGTELSFLVNVPAINTNLPPNMRMVAGDPSLEVQTQAINQIAAQTLPPTAWANVHRWVMDMVDAITTQIPSSVFFIDCNPSFSSYTELALVAADRLIVPCTADGSSARAIDNIGQLLYGINVPPLYQNANFATQANKSGISLPSIHLVPLNRSTQYDKEASKAFGAMYSEIQTRVNNLRAQAQASFSTPANQSPFLEIPDAHAVSVVASHYGLPLASLKAKAYDIHGFPSKINKGPLDRYVKAVTLLVNQL